MNEEAVVPTGAISNSPTSPRRRSWRRRLIFAAICLTICCLIGEIGLRMGGYTPRYVNILATFHRYDPHLGFVGRSGIEGEIHSPEFVIEMNYTTEGFRRVAANNPSAERILYVLGDSFSWGAGVDETLCDLLAQKTPEWNVKNYSLPGFGTLQEQRVFERYVAPELTPRDAVVIVHYGNDFDDNLGRHLTNLPRAVVSQTGAIEIAPPPETAWLTEAKNYLKRNSRLWNFIAYTHDFRKLESRVKTDLTAELQTSTPNARSPEFTSLNADDPRMLVMRETLSQIKSACDERGVPLILVRVPFREEFGEALAAEAQDQKSDLVYVPSIQELARELKIPLLELLDPFRDWKSHHGGRLTYPSDLHWNETAHDLAATTVLGYLDSQLLRDDRMAADSATKPVSRQ